jgi:uncharacterized protein YijF (DUF1287 family)/L,D-peptidoglycan transpeptidase YkuD (ErfK/YbiS/YcfS/YnhG family)
MPSPWSFNSLTEKWAVWHFPLVVASLLPLACETSAVPGPRTARQETGHQAVSEGTSPSPPRSPKVHRARVQATPKDSPSPLRADVGVFPEFNEKISIVCPSWLSEGPMIRVRLKRSNRTFLSVDGFVVCEANASHQSTPLIELDEGTTHDADLDGFMDSLDLLRGAKKAVLNGARYQGGYVEIGFPGGDVPRTQGVCTDVVIRSLRNGGVDLQELLQTDIREHPERYPMVKKPDPHIDHRRVRTLLPYFEAHFAQLVTDPNDSAVPYFPGDVIFMNTMGDARPEHLGIVSDRLGSSGSPLIVNNWNDGTTTAEMDLLGRVPVTHRFRTTRPFAFPNSHRGLEGFVRRLGTNLPVRTRQVVSVTTPLWNSSGGVLQRWERRANGFQVVGERVPVRIGAAGFGQGLGLHSQPWTSREKREGDRRAPAGLFSLGTAFGRQKRAPFSGNWPYREAGPNDYWVDDPTVSEYNTWQTLPPRRTAPWSAERLASYAFGLVVDHNRGAAIPGAGSAIFFHPWKSKMTPTVGCTAMAPELLKELLTWLDPDDHPLLLQAAGRIAGESAPHQ